MNLRSVQELTFTLLLLFGCDVSPGLQAIQDPDFAAEHDYPLVVPDNGSNRVKILAPLSRRVLTEVDLAALAPDQCSGANGCMIFSASHALLEGHDMLDLTYGLSTNGLSVGFEGNIDRVRLTSPPTLQWRLHELNFSGLPEGASAYCPADPADPCRPRTDVPLYQQDLCFVGDAHDFEVLSDDTVAQRAEILVADTDNYRLLKVTLNYADGNTCGRVDSILDATRNADWASLAQPNNLVHLVRGGRELVIVTYRSTTLTEGWLDGNGLIQLWELEADGRWRLHWTFPKPSDDGGMRVLHYPHGGELFPHAHPEGDLFRFADSASLSTAADENVYSSPGGSVGVLLLRNVLDPPDYLYDHDVSSGKNLWRFPRAATKWEDGTILVTDSGCIAPNSCPYPGRLVWVPDTVESDSSRLGYWTPDHLQLELIGQASAVVRTLECGLVSPFMSQGVPIEQWGEELEALMTQGGRPCP